MAIGAVALVASELAEELRGVIEATPVVDMHTHLFSPGFCELALSGIDDLLTYHYLEAEFFRVSALAPDQYRQLSKAERANRIWQALFVERTPISESTRGVVATLTTLGLDPSASLTAIRERCAHQDAAEHVTRVFRLSGVSHVVMTNDPLDAREMELWEGVAPDSRFRTSLRLDRLLNEWDDHWPMLAAQGSSVTAAPHAETLAEVRRFLTACVARLQPVYMAVSLPDSFAFPADEVRSTLLAGAVLPVCREHGLALALMIGVRRQVNPSLGLAGDALGRADVSAVARLCAAYPANRFLVSVLSRENQHELCVYARKFANLLPFGCWWFLNSPSIVEEITRERVEMLGTSFIPQHSDARVLEHLLYKWRDTRRILAPILEASYRRLIADGGIVTRDHLQRDVERLFRVNLEEWTGRSFSTL